MIIAIDFDGTIVDHKFPYMGALKPNCKEVINRLHEEGHYIIIWTCRTPQNHYLDDARATPTIFDVHEFLHNEGILHHTINANDPDLWFQPHPKVYADLYIDDRNLGGIPEDWEEIYKLIQKHPHTPLIPKDK